MPNIGRFASTVPTNLPTIIGPTYNLYIIYYYADLVLGDKNNETLMQHLQVLYILRTILLQKLVIRKIGQPCYFATFHAVA